MIFGIVIATIGFSGVARLADKAVGSVKETAQTVAK
jgi:hypothetical protein